MASFDLYNPSGEKVGTVELADEVFAGEVREDLIHQTVRWQLAKRRSGSSKTKNRSEVKGGGAKPHRQKGTGRARHGSRTSGIHRGGGTIFGPAPRDYSFKLPKKIRRAALRSALSSLTPGNVYVFEKLDLPEVKTRLMVSLLERLGIDKALLVDEPNFKVNLASRNIPGIKFLPVEGLNVFDILRHRKLVISLDAARKVEERLGR